MFPLNIFYANSDRLMLLSFIDCYIYLYVCWENIENLEPSGGRGRSYIFPYCHFQASHSKIRVSLFYSQLPIFFLSRLSLRTIFAGVSFSVQ